MEKKDLNRYNFDKIVSRTKNEFELIKRGTEENFTRYLSKIEQFLYTAYEEYNITGKEAQNILKICLFDMQKYIYDIEYNYTELIEEKLICLAKELDKLFIPFENKELSDMLQEVNFEDKSILTQIFSLPIKCILRIYDSIEQWTKHGGEYGYFKFIGKFLHEIIPLDSHPFIIEDKYLKEMKKALLSSC